MMVGRYIIKTLQLTCVVSLIRALSSNQVLAGVPEALAKEPGEYRILRSLVEVKFFQKKYKEAKPLAE